MIQFFALAPAVSWLIPFFLTLRGWKVSEATAVGVSAFFAVGGLFLLASPAFSVYALYGVPAFTLATFGFAEAGVCFRQFTTWLKP